MAVQGISEIVFRTPYGTFWDHSGRFLGRGGGGREEGPAGSLTSSKLVNQPSVNQKIIYFVSFTNNVSQLVYCIQTRKVYFPALMAWDYL